MKRDPDDWDDETLRTCSEVLENVVVMNLLNTLAIGSIKHLLIEMRHALQLQDFPRASVLEAQASAWEQAPRLIHALAMEWREKMRS